MCLDPAVPRAYGQHGCAEQSPRARTLQAWTAETVAQRDRVPWYSWKRYGPTQPHRFAEYLWWHAVDVTPRAIGAQAAGSARTWLGCHRSQTGRQTLRCTASAFRAMLPDSELTPYRHNVRL